MSEPSEAARALLDITGWEVTFHAESPLIIAALLAALTEGTTLEVSIHPVTCAIKIRRKQEAK